MKRTSILALGLLVVPAVVAAQVEVGLDGGLAYQDVDGATDATFGLQLPMSAARVAFSAGPRLLIETRLVFDWSKEGDLTDRGLILLPGVNYLINDQVYVRGNIGLLNFSNDVSTTVTSSGTQYIFGGALGMRRSLGSGAVLRLEAGADQWLENQDDLLAAQLNIHGTVGVSAVIGG